MDFLKAEIQSKKRQLENLSPSPGPSSSTTNGDEPPVKRYLKRSELERLRAQEEREKQQEKERLRKEKLYGTKPQANSTTTTATLNPATGTTITTTIEQAGDGQGETFNVSNEEAIRRLRKIGQPIRLFAETDKERRLRLRALELIEERTEGQRNDFARAMEGQELGIEREKEKNKNGESSSQKKQDKKGKGAAGTTTTPATETEAEKEESREPKPKDEEVLVDLELVKTNPHKVYPQIYHALKRVLKEWEQSLADRPESVKRSTQGKVAAATQSTSAEYLKPLFKQLRKRDLAADVLLAIAEITFYMQTREYLRANDAYLRLSIGNAPWPIGVTMVGIHERSGREKIFSSNVAHALNDETSRKYIQSLKRLLTFAQAIRPPADVSQKMG
ncbi:mRNA splicing protein PRP18 [Sporobolomyces salmoneus]|uniref:mRNA splicing protein PRP18 n=1 Tax=Sporobolomyces salmoneus TaxID=183962 RepID=UPI00316FC403